MRRRCARNERRARLLSLGLLLKMGEDTLDERGVLDARNHLELPAALPTRLDLDREHTFQPLRLLIEMCFGTSRSAAASTRRAPRPAGVIAARSAWCGANTPWYLVRWPASVPQRVRLK